MPWLNFKVTNQSLAFVDGIRVNAPGADLLDVQVLASRSIAADDWTPLPQSTLTHSDGASVRFADPTNALQFRVDVAYRQIGPYTCALELHPVLDVASAAVWMKSKSICFVGCARQCALALETTLSKIQELGSLFAAYDVFVFENDSTDHTNAQLQAASTRLPLRFESTTGLDAVLPRRTERLAYGRNRCLRHVMSLQKMPDYVCVLDFDGLLDQSHPSRDAFIDSFRYHGCWDAVFPLNDGIYYDVWALRQRDVCVDDYTRRGAAMDAAFGRPLAVQFAATFLQQALCRLEGWLPVESAFGGMALYKTDVLRGVHYRGFADGRDLCEHVFAHRLMALRGARLFINPGFVVNSHG